MPHTVESSALRKTAKGLGFSASLLAAVLALSFAALAILFSPPEWTGIEAYAESINLMQMLNMIPVIFLTFTVIAVVACVHYLAPESKRVYSLIALALSSAYAAIICTNYYLQLFVVRLNLYSGDLEGIALLAMPNLHSVFFALETIGYAFLSVATFFLLPVITGGGLQKWIRLFLLLSGGTGIFGAVVAVFDQPVLIFAGLGIWSLSFPLAMILLSIHFRRAT